MDTDAHRSKTKELSVSIRVNPWLKSVFQQRVKPAPRGAGFILRRASARLGCCAFFLATFTAGAQTFSQHGYLDFNGFFFPQSAANDSSHNVGEATLRYEASIKIGQALTLSGAIDARTDSHHATRREFVFSYWGRGRQRPAFAARRLNATYTRGKLTVTFGKQLI